MAQCPGGGAGLVGPGCPVEPAHQVRACLVGIPAGGQERQQRAGSTLAAVTAALTACRATFSARICLIWYSGARAIDSSCSAARAFFSDRRRRTSGLPSSAAGGSKRCPPATM